VKLHLRGVERGRSIAACGTIGTRACDLTDDWERVTCWHCDALTGTPLFEERVEQANRLAPRSSPTNSRRYRT
jgi:hypothetical protein